MPAKKPAKKMKPVKAWILYSDEGKLAAMRNSGLLLMWPTKANALEYKRDGESVRRVEVREL